MSSAAAAPSFISRLADVELHLCMHGLEVKDLIAFARCSRRMLQLARMPFAWKRSPMIRIEANQMPTVNTESSFTLPLLQYASISLSWRLISTNSRRRFKHHSDRLSSPSAEQLSELMTIFDSFTGSRLLEFDGSARAIDDEQWCLILSHPSMQSIQCLHLSARCSTIEPCQEMFRLINLLPHLQSLYLSSRFAFDVAPWSLLAPSSSLTSLHIADSMGNPNASFLRHIHSLIGVRNLTISSPSFYDGSFLPFFSSSLMQRLESLTLDGFFAGGYESFNLRAPSADMYAESFRHLHCLHSLTLRCIDRIDSLIPALLAAPVLRHLIIRPACYADGDDGADSVLSTVNLTQLLKSRSMMICTIIRPKEGHFVNLRQFIHANERINECATAVEMKERFRLVD